MASIDGQLITPASIPGDRLKNAAGLLRSQFAQTSNAPLRITPFQWRVWNSGALLTTAGTDDLGLNAGTFGTDNFTVQAGDLKAAGATTRYALTQVALPDYYDDGQTVTLRLHAGMQTTVADTSCFIDAEVYVVADDGTPSSGDLCATAQQSMNSLTGADLDFVITPTTLVNGDTLEIRVAVICTDGASGTAVTPVLYRASVLFDARG